MNPILTRLGVSKEIQDFFAIDELLFGYGEHFEHFDTGFHRVPTTQNLWLAGKDLSREVIITSTAMEAIAFAALNHYRYPNLDGLCFIAIGNLPQAGQLKWIRSNFRKRKFTLVFGRDLLGRLADIKVAAGLCHKDIHLLRSDVQIQIRCEDVVYGFQQDRLSLNAFEKAAGFRTGIRTSKPREFDTYLDQLRYDTKQ